MGRALVVKAFRYSAVEKQVTSAPTAGNASEALNPNLTCTAACFCHDKQYEV